MPLPAIDIMISLPEMSSRERNRDNKLTKPFSKIFARKAGTFFAGKVLRYGRSIIPADMARCTVLYLKAAGAEMS